MMEKMKILAVDDNAISLATIEQELKKDYELTLINSGARALQYLKREKTDLILLDIQMEQKDGIETLRDIRKMEKCRDIPVIMLTSKQEKATVVETSKLGICDYVLKPFKGEELHKRIDRILKNNGNNKNSSNNSDNKPDLMSTQMSLLELERRGI